jgi:hypothetical protein
VQDPTPFRSLHIVLDPHGEGLQGSGYSSRIGAKNFMTNRKIPSYSLKKN